MPRQPGPNPEFLIGELVQGMSPEDRYRDPDARERAAARQAARALLDDRSTTADVDPLFEALGLDTHHGADPATGRPFSLYLATGSDDRAWGAVLVDRSATPRTVIEVPHPGFDINTDKLGLSLHRQVPASVLLIAGAHREAGNGDADVAHNNKSLFHALAVEFAENGLDQVQLHGFADRNLPSSDAVVSTGSAPVRPVARRIASGLSEAGLKVCQAWVNRCGQLEGKRNEQGLATAELESAFVHLELSWSIRQDGEARDRVAAALAEQLTSV
ncbi:hypothetical protein [Micromonospora sp. LH3U1]|uniref:hypothetical protein n=1 Tax=Micromonospora sp. LH3U1 TaxID=3018339 RepID=UPI00234BE63C|nr:hypothetical protein [Micromonospora sp. LH3U1]WCN82128.1 hypothetical protein PCA76_03265 [Micromonospora sp. LH3U1]